MDGHVLSSDHLYFGMPSADFCFRAFFHFNSLPVLVMTVGAIETGTERPDGGQARQQNQNNNGKHTGTLKAEAEEQNKKHHMWMTVGIK